MLCKVKNTPVGLSLMNSIMSWLGLPEAAFFNCDGALAIMTTELKDQNLFFMGAFFVVRTRISLRDA